MNDAVRVLALLSVAEQRTSVRPILKRLPDFGLHETGTLPSTASAASSLYVTRMRFIPRGARTILSTAPVIVGGVRSNSKLGTTNVPVQVSVPTAWPPGRPARLSAVEVGPRSGRCPRGARRARSSRGGGGDSARTRRGGK